MGREIGDGPPVGVGDRAEGDEAAGAVVVGRERGGEGHGGSVRWGGVGVEKGRRGAGRNSAGAARAGASGFHRREQGPRGREGVVRGGGGLPGVPGVRDGFRRENRRLYLPGRWQGPS
ncbi:hypothetical protein JCM18897A_34680 [Streptomyces sp. JCM 18897]